MNLKRLTIEALHVTAISGVSAREAFREAMILALEEDRKVTLTLGGERYEFSASALIDGVQPE